MSQKVFLLSYVHASTEGLLFMFGARAYASCRNNPLSQDGEIAV